MATLGFYPYLLTLEFITLIKLLFLDHFPFPFQGVLSGSLVLGALRFRGLSLDLKVCVFLQAMCLLFCMMKVC